MVDEGVANPHGEALMQELLWVHGIIRHNLETIAAVIEQIINGAPVAQVRAQIDDLAATSVVWTLRVNCLQYCSLVHHHHHLEDVALFPGLRRVNPKLHSVIEKLEADHTIVSGYLDAVEAAAKRIVGDEAARAELADALRQLAAHLLTHLDYEEANLAPTLRRLQGWPRG
jgi:hemerythrin-like domain-containing protein